ncbi:hypothetical protein Snoj_27410 [Streptomyces nojiriensis]|uniref:Uncharacterized protein n=1 Tax=Streptomyces nojiriensis TaxID=66374 RepID=A0ABQ3SL03_9ACTN|nr:hypothetical protein Snoj_27410 [Streptomyces nojiriensis]
MTTDLARAREWLESWTDVSGVEGILVKPLNGRYLPGYRGWTKIRRRDTTEAIVGAITGTLTRPGLLVLGRHDHDGRLRAVGRTVPLRPDAARQVAEHLTAAAPGHPWTGAKFSATWGSRDVLDTTLVHPALVAEISGRPRHRPRRRLPPPPLVPAAAPGRDHRGCPSVWKRSGFSGGVRVGRPPFGRRVLSVAAVWPAERLRVSTWPPCRGHA